MLKAIDPLKTIFPVTGHQCTEIEHLSPTNQAILNRGRLSRFTSEIMEFVN